MRIISANLNGIRSAATKGFFPWLGKQKADIICVMDNGSIVETGGHAELLARDGAYARLCRAQLLIEAESPSTALN